MLLIQFILVSFTFLLLLSAMSRIVGRSHEFIINKYLKLRLEQERTMIYVKNQPFRQCMYLLMNIRTDKIREYDEIRSIDEAAVSLDRSLEGHHNNRIPAETEFWGHCSVRHEAVWLNAET